MRVHHNSFVHKDKESTHEKEKEAIDKAIQDEFRRGLDGLPGEFAGDIRRDVKQLVESDDNNETTMVGIFMVCT